MLLIFHRTVRSEATDTEPVGSASALPSAPIDTARDDGASTGERAATYEELMPYLVLAMAAGI
ncbi:hypothetical protein P3T43_007050 [Paraburkholderia sp. GAS41]|jgi:hypothetical protein|uniref:hypothetical protein n=1 Tax=Paraburkholderia sp. GAS41 TaxID=3035134 RepID=UPI003D1C11AA